MKTVFVVQHLRPESGDYFEDVKLIGVYSTRAAGDEAIARLKLQPGFRDFPDSFSNDEYQLDKDHWSDGFELF